MEGEKLPFNPCCFFSSTINTLVSEGPRDSDWRCNGWFVGVGKLSLALPRGVGSATDGAEKCFTLLQILQFLQIRGLWQPCLEQVYRHHFFPTAFVHFVSLCHILVILRIFPTFSLLLYLPWWSVVSDLWCHYYNSLKAQLMVSVF